MSNPMFLLFISLLAFTGFCIWLSSYTKKEHWRVFYSFLAHLGITGILAVFFLVFWYVYRMTLEWIYIPLGGLAG